MASTGLTAVLKANCTVCGSPFRAKVNSEINRGLSQRGIAHRYGLHKDAIRRHTNSRHPGVRVESDEALVPPDGEETGGEERRAEPQKTPRQKLEALIASMEQQKVGGMMRVEVARELRIAYSELAKMTDGDRPKAESYRDLEGWAELERALYRALEPYPEATRAVSKALGGETDE